jgi:hypothetical protein
MLEKAPQRIELTTMTLGPAASSARCRAGWGKASGGASAAVRRLVVAAAIVTLRGPAAAEQARVLIAERRCGAVCQRTYELLRPSQAWCGAWIGGAVALGLTCSANRRIGRWLTSGDTRPRSLQPAHSQPTSEVLLVA